MPADQQHEQDPQKKAAAGGGRRPADSDTPLTDQSQFPLNGEATVIGHAAETDADVQNMVNAAGHGQQPPTVVDVAGNADSLERRKDSVEVNREAQTLLWSTGDARPSQVQPQSTLRQLGDYEILGELGRGGMGVVFKARHRTLNRIVALKMILSGRYSGADPVRRFVSEARAVARLQHSGIVQIFEIGEHTDVDGEKLPYFSLEFVPGSDLQKELNGQPRNARYAAEIVEQLARAMQYAHDNSVLHRDLKPANILLDGTGKPKITDFGLAREVDETASGATSEGTIMGSPSYMPPEQARGELSSITPRSDLYSLGAILYQILTGRPPFLTDRPLQTVLQVINNDPVSPRQLQPDMPKDIETICLKAMQKEQAARYSSCSELAADLRRFLHGEPILARPVSRAERLWRWCRRNPLIALPSLATGLLVIVTAIVSTWAWRETSAQALMIAQERDTANQQRILVDEQRGLADEQRLIAVENENRARREQEEAERQRLLAAEAQLQAEKSQQLAERQALLALQNIQLVVTEIDDRLAREPGTSDLRISILKIVEKKWDELDLAMAGGLRGQAIPTLMAVRSKLADVWTSLDSLQDADAQYTRLHKQAKERLIVKNRNDASRFNMSLICLRWAPVRQRLTGNSADGDALLHEATALLRDILADPRPEEGSPAAYQIADVLQQTLMRSAAALMKRGALRDADAAYAEVGELCTSVLNEMDQPAAWMTGMPQDRQALIRNHFEQNLDLSRTGQANVLCRRGRIDQAIPLFEAVVERRREALRKSPADRNAREQLALQLRNYGQYMLRAGRADEAARLMGQSNDLAEQNFNDDPANSNFKRAFGHSQYYLATARDAQGHRDEALALFERSRFLRSEMHENSPDQANTINLMLAEARVGNIEATQQRVEELSTSASDDPELFLDIARALVQLARHADEDAARGELRDSALAALERCVAAGLRDPFPVSAEPDLIPLRNDDRFADIVRQLTEIQQAHDTAD